jgi:hypothetical protein
MWFEAPDVPRCLELGWLSPEAGVGSVDTYILLGNPPDWRRRESLLLGNSLCSMRSRLVPTGAWVGYCWRIGAGTGQRYEAS